PIALGYKKSLAYLNSGNDFWTYTMTGGACGINSKTKLTDIWQDGAPAFGLKPARTCNHNAQTGCVYEDELFETRAVQWIKAHDAREPLFMVYAPRAVTAPWRPPR
ncbi:hypothetical protein JKP88DRAFT_133602, partial [Tribonema minus]